jgi:hypothetical protein
MPCPFFLPTEKFEAIALPHRARLPLGDGWSGQCTAPGHEGFTPNAQELADLCNLGYANQCSRLPAERRWDAIRFGVARDAGSSISLTYVCEAGHCPVEHGTLEFDGSRWTVPHCDTRLQRMAECYLEVYLSRRNKLSAEPNQ